MRHDIGKMMTCAIPAIALSVVAAPALANDAVQRSATSIGQPMASLDKDMRVSRLIGTEVIGSDGKKVGEVEDLVIDTREGTVVHAVIQSDELFGRDEMMAIPLDRAHGGMRDGRFVLDASAEQMREFRRFGADAWPNWNGSDGDAAERRYRRASDLLDADLKDRSGRDVGNVEDIVVNIGSGKVRYGVAEFDTSWFEAGKLVVVPLTNVRSEGNDGDDLVLTADRQALRDAPSFERSQWPDLNDNTFRRDLDRYAASDAQG